MFKKICSLFLVAILILSIVPSAFAVSDLELILLLSPDSELAETVDVSLFVKCTQKISENGVYSYFSYNTDHLDLVDSDGKVIDLSAFENGVTFIGNGVAGVECAEGWDDDASFVKTIDNKQIFGFEVAPREATDVSEGVKIATARFKIKADSYAGFDKAWITPLSESIGEIAFPAAAYTPSGLVESAAAIDYSDSFEKIICSHTWSNIIYEDPQNGIDGKAYYQCLKCALKTAVKVDDDGSFIPESKTVDFIGDLQQREYSVIPAPTANNFNYESASGRTSYDYRTRGAAIRCTEPLDGDYTTMRFAESYYLPQPNSECTENEAKTLKINDFGVVYSLSSSLLKSGSEQASEDASLLNIDKLNIDGISGGFGTNTSGIDCAICSLKYPASDDGFRYSTYNLGGEYTGSSINSTQKLATASYVTYNLVIRVIQENYKRFYAVRPFVTYEYLGKEFTLYDTDESENPACSSRSVYYVAERAARNPAELEENREYINNHILSLYN